VARSRSVVTQALAAARPGQQVTVTITRAAPHLTVHVTLGELPAA
jgi:S1-C subfamily serine protease